MLTTTYYNGTSVTETVADPGETTHGPSVGCTGTDCGWCERSGDFYRAFYNDASILSVMGGVFSEWTTGGRVCALDPPTSFQTCCERPATVTPTPLASCAAILGASSTAPTGLHMINPGAPFRAHCDMTLQGGGWTLIGTNARGGGWNTTNIQDATTFGPPALTPLLTTDHKSEAFNTVLFTDIMFTSPLLHAVYGGVGTGAQTYFSFQDAIPRANCPIPIGSMFEWPMTAGTLAVGAGSSLCNTNLYMHPGDHDGSPGSCNIGSGFSVPAIGPAWSSVNNNTCPLDDPDGAMFINEGYSHSIWDRTLPLRMFVR
ncbi:hypothetical protein JYT86_00790 [bacterium AH-315-N03]|nr:hypothetical protein [bacterium AH-315-N03]